jgi:tetratricopeptide (TPR) repeat protein
VDPAISDYDTLLSRPDLTILETQLANFNLGVLHHRKGDVEKCLSHWERVASLRLPPSDALLEPEGVELAAAANMNLGAHYALLKQWEKGLGYLVNAAELDPEDGEVRFNIGATLAGMGKFEEAIAEFEIAEERGVESAREVIEKIRQGMEENKLGEGQKEPGSDAIANESEKGQK